MSNKNILEVTIESKHSTQSVVLELSTASCWSKFLGDYPVPSEGAIEQLDTALSDQKPTQITLKSCPSAALLPLFWMRTIWFSTNAPKLVIHWLSDDGPSSSSHQSAAKLACTLADEVVIGDPGQAWEQWGIDTAHSDHEEAYELLDNLLDRLRNTNEQAQLATNCAELLQLAFTQCASNHQARIAIYGAGTHTRAAGNAMIDPCVEIVCIIDDDKRRHATRMWGYEIVSCDQALELNLDAVVISSDSIEDKLWANAMVFRDLGIPTIRLYGSNEPA